ncbi:SLAP domain-containing protein [Sporosarcina limicola]|uniref:SLAP domain-containing protein n=1 Tax=Sporosarcina limicola TaxID=34101 RepID=A0A927R396_9BACL|nr:SLAP domain-containing protein [Sporosarcina limicola]MBE1554836.1 SLAP domain-containing protein [Sporosarcina limicola]
MQKLYFEPAWDKAIAPIDREKITHHFHQQTKQLQVGVHLSFLWNARNHKDEQLITVLIHNFEETIFHLDNTVISYYEQGEKTANATFSLPCEVTGNTSMPWTFIFSETNGTNADSRYTIWN